MRHPLQPIVTTTLVSCLLALVVTGSRPRPSAQHQRAFSITPAAAGIATVQRRSAGSTYPTRARPGPETAITSKLGANLSLEAPDDAEGKPPMALDTWDARPPRRLADRATTPTTSSGVGAHSTGSTIHTVEAGDTVYDLAARYGVSPEAILGANGLDEQGARSLDIGQELVIPIGPEGGDRQQPLSVPRVVHQVQSGEALIIIAQDYGTTVESIVVANDLVDAELILAGQELIVPVPPGTPLAPPADPISGTEQLTQTNALAAAPQLAPDEPVSPTPALTQSLVITQLAPDEPVSPTLALAQSLVITQTDAAEPVSPTLALTQSLVMTQTDTADMVLEMGATEPISAAGLVADTPAMTETIPTKPMTDTAGIEEAPPEPLADAAPTEELGTLEAAMLEAVNAEREAHGLPPYRLDDTLAAVARAHAQDMVARDYVGHTSPDGDRVRGRLRDAGMDLDRAGENYYVTTRPAEEAVAHTLSWFMGDPPHRDNLLHDYYTRIGVGVAHKPSGWYIFVLDFAGD